MIRPILFNTEMVTAILEDRKTATRRLIKPQPKEDMKYKLGYCVMGGHKKDIGKFGFGTREWGGRILYARPPALIGDILYVRETWSEIKNSDGSHKKYVYKATDIFPFGEKGYICKFCWHPSIHMPKEATRIWLKVTDVKPERLQNMWASDVSKEGLLFTKPHTAEEMLKKFERLWNSTIKKSDIALYGWDANPWVWVIEFERCEKPEGWCV